MNKENTIKIDERVSNKMIVVDTEAETDDLERKKFFEDLNRAVDRSEDDIKHGRMHDAKEVFKELRKNMAINNYYISFTANAKEELMENMNI